MFLIFIFILFNCKNHSLRVNRAKTGFEDVKAASEVLSSIKLDKLLGGLVDLLTLPIVLSSEVLYNRIREYLEGLALSDEQDEYIQFLNAVEKGNSREALKFLNSLKKSEDETFFDDSIGSENGTLPLHLAIEKGMTAVVKRMIEMNATLSERDASDLTPLMLAIKMYRSEIFVKILNKLSEDGLIEIYLNQINNASFTALHWAILYNRQDNSLIKELKNRGAKIQRREGGGLNSLNELHFACLVGNFTAVEALAEKYKIECDQDIEKVKNKISEKTIGFKEESPFHFAAISGSKPIYKVLTDIVCKELSEFRLPLTSLEETPLHYLTFTNVLGLKIEDKRLNERSAGQKLLVEDLSGYLGIKEDPKKFLLDYILNECGELFLDIEDYKQLGKKGGGPILHKTTRGLTMLHYAILCGNKNIFVAAIKRLKADLEKKKFSLELLTDLEIKEDDSSEDEIFDIKNKSLLSLAYNLDRKNIFEFIVKELPEILEIQNIIEDMQIDKIIIKKSENSDDEVVYITNDKAIESSKLKLYMLIIGYKFFDVEKSPEASEILKSSDRFNRYRDEYSLYIIEDKIDVISSEKAEDDRDLKMFLNDSALRKLFHINYENNLESYGLRSKLSDEINLLNENNLTKVDPSNKNRYIHAAIYTSNPYDYIRKLIEEFRNSDSITIQDLLNSEIEVGEGKDKRIIDILVENNFPRLTKFIIDKGASIFNEEDEDAESFSDEESSSFNEETENNESSSYEGTSISSEENTIFESPLHVAAKNGYSDTLYFLCEKLKESKGDYKKYLKDENNKCPIHYAIENGHVKCVEILTEDISLFNVFYDDNLNIQLINFAMEVDNDDVRNNIFNRIENKDFYDFKGDNILAMSIKAGSEGSTDFILDNYPEIIDKRNKEKETPLHVAIKEKKFKLALKLIDKGADPNLGGDPNHLGKCRYNAISEIAYNLRVEKLNADDRERIHKILKNERVDINRKYRKKIGDKNEKFLLSIFIERKMYEEAAICLNEDILEKYPRSEIFKMIIETNNYNLNEKLLKEYCKRDGVEFYLVDTKTKIDDTPLTRAAKSGFDESFIALLRFGDSRNKMLAPIEFLIYASIKHYREGDNLILERVVEHIKQIVKDELTKNKKAKLSEKETTKKIIGKALSKIIKDSGISCGNISLKDYIEDSKKDEILNKAIEYFENQGIFEKKLVNSSNQRELSL